MANPSEQPAAISHQPPAILQPPTVEHLERTRLWTASLRVLPDFLIIGAQKAGTTSLYHYLDKHPQIRTALAKEVHFFDYNYGLGENWYRAHFPTYLEKWRGAFKTGEASPYYLFYPHAPLRVKQILPHVQLIVLLRNPIERAYSHYQHQVRLGLEELPFEEALEQEPTRLLGEFENIILDDEYYSFNYQNYSYLARGMYADQLERWFRLFPREQFLILPSDEFYAYTAGAYARVQEFLHVPKHMPPSFEVANDGTYAPMQPETRAWLAEFFEPHNTRLYELLNVDFDWK